MYHNTDLDENQGLKAKLDSTEDVAVIYLGVEDEFFPGEIKEMMRKNGALGAMMSGSGPTVFAIVTDEEEADLLSDFLKKTNSETYLTGLV